MKSYLTHLECTACGVSYEVDQVHRTCQSCQKVLYARYDLENVRKHVDRRIFKDRADTMWRCFELLPVVNPDHIVSLGEGMTPLMAAPTLGKDLGCSRLLIKEEGLNPTGSFKARGLSAAVSKAKELGQLRLTVPSAGNAAGALAAYCAQGSLEAHVFMPKDAPIANQQECIAFGANLTLVDGLISDAGRLSREKATREGLFDVSTLQEPYRAEGKKTMGYEIVEQLGWHTPDVIVYPTGGGTGIVGIWKAFQEMLALGWIESINTRMIAVQAEGCAPIVRAFQEGKELAEAWVDASTIAAGIRVPSAIGDYLILQALRESAGAAVTVSDQEMVEAVKEMARKEGVFPAPEGGATLAGLKKLLRDGSIDPDGTIVLMNTGAAYKYLDALAM